MDPNWVILNHLRVVGFWAVGGVTGHPPCTRASQRGAPPPDGHAGKISRPTAAGRTRIGPAKQRQRPPWITGPFFIFRPFPANPYLLPTILDPLNSFPWSFSPDSSPFKRSGKNKFDRLLDQVFHPPQQPLDQGKGTDVFLVSWAFHCMWFVNFGCRVVSFPFLGCFG